MVEVFKFSKFTWPLNVSLGRKGMIKTIVTQINTEITHKKEGGNTKMKVEEKIIQELNQIKVKRCTIFYRQNRFDGNLFSV